MAPYVSVPIPYKNGYMYTKLSLEDYEKYDGEMYIKKDNTTNPPNFYVAIKLDKNVSPVDMHRVLMGTPVGRKVDHINGHCLDNRRENLRVVNDTQSAINRRKFSTMNGKETSSNFKGVSWCKGSGKWRALITLNKKIVHLGRFATEEQAHQAYCEAATKHFGEYARSI